MALTDFYKWATLHKLGGLLVRQLFRQGFGLLAAWFLVSCQPADGPSALSRESNAGPGTQSQDERDAVVQSVSISPGDFTLRLGNAANLVAVARDAEGNAVPGVTFQWGAKDAKGKPVPINSSGTFEALVPGTFTIAAVSSHGSGIVRVKVPDEAISTGLPTTSESSGETPLLCKAATTAPAAVPAAVPVNAGAGAGFNSANLSVVLAPGNRRSVVPNDALHKIPLVTHRSDSSKNVALAIQTAGNSNFTFSTPVLSMPGRGTTPGLNLNYNSLLWTAVPTGTIGNTTLSRVSFNIDGDWPAPGFTLSFGRLVDVGGDNAMFVDGTGDRHPFSGSTSASGGNTVFVGYTTDGTLIDYSATFDASGDILSGQLQYPDGTAVAFNAAGAGAVHATQITDRNGNYLTITYGSQGAPAISVVSDTLGRLYQFNYDANGLLVGVTGPGLAGTTRELIHITYQSLPAFQALLSGTTSGFTLPFNISAQTTQYQFIQSITYPGANTGYWFGDSSSYSAYGMIAKVSERVGISLSGNSYTVQGTVSASGIVRRETDYNYPLTASQLQTIPSYTTATETWANMDTGPAVTTFVIHETSSPRTVAVTTPDNVTTIQYAYNSPGGSDAGVPAYEDGLTYKVETHTGGATGPLVGELDFTYEQGGRGNARLTSVKTTDEKGQVIQTTTSYYPGVNTDQMYIVADYGYSGELLRPTVYDSYVSDPGYTNRHIFNLPSVVSVRDASWNTISRTAFSYDAQRGQQLLNTPTSSGHLVGHLDTFNPYEPYSCQPPVCKVVCSGCPIVCTQTCAPPVCTGYYLPATDYRGNVSSVTVYSNAGAQTGALTKSFTYDIAGNKVISTSASGVVSTSTYTANTVFAYPEKVTLGSGQAQMTIGAQYDVSTGLETSAVDANGQTLTFVYDASSLRLISTIRSTGAHTDISYADASFASTATTYLSSGTGLVGSQMGIIQNGLGLVKSSRALAEPQSSGLSDFIEINYDASGRVSAQSMPYRSAARMTSGLSFETTAYDFAGRATARVAADGVSTSYLCYNEYNCHKVEASPSSSSGATIRSEDPWGRQRWSRWDALGRLVEAVEPNPSGPNGSVSDSGALHSSYSYDGLGNLTGVSQGAQTRTFVYDSLSRMVAQRLAEKNGTLSAGGVYGQGSYSDVFIFDPATGNLAAHVDARGVKTNLSYETGGLNRLLSVSFDTSGVGDPTQAVASVPTVSFTYAASGDLTRVATRTASGVATETFGYDPFGRLGSDQVILAARSSYPLETDYAYDTMDRLIAVTYPVPYGFSTARRIVSTPIGVDGRLKQVLVDAAQTPHATGITYTPSGSVATATIGIANQYQGAEVYTYEASSGLLLAQTVQGNGNSLLNLTYSYTHQKYGAAPGSGAYRTGQVVSVANGVNSFEGRSYTYDTLSRLVGAAGGNLIGTTDWTQTYSYDRYGNRLDVSATGSAAGSGGPIPVDGLPTTGFGPDSQNNRITDAGWVYDDEGNVLRGRVGTSVWEQFSYDAAGRLAAVCQDSGVDSSGKLLKPCLTAQGATGSPVIESYKYGVDRERLAVQSGTDANARQYYARANGVVVMVYAETDGAPTSPQYSKSTVFLGGRLLSSATPAGNTETWQFYHPDRLGTRLIVTAGTAKEQGTLPFGTEIPAESTGSTNYRFTSYDRNEETALDYAMNRYYAAPQGRYIQVDPIAQKSSTAGDPQSMNLYCYGKNDPINATDPSGLDIAIMTCYWWRWDFLDGTYGDKNDLGCVVVGLSSGNTASQSAPNGGGGTNSIRKDVVKRYSKALFCTSTATQVMTAVENNFANFANFSTVNLFPTMFESVTFSPPDSLAPGSSIPISINVSAINPFDLWSPLQLNLNTSVIVQSVTNQSMTFSTVPGHLLYPATISFSATQASAAMVNFNIDITGQFPNLVNQGLFYAGGGAFENAQWNNMINNVGAFCAAGGP
jgi:RHS repeat-associated protein